MIVFFVIVILPIIFAPIFDGFTINRLFSARLLPSLSMYKKEFALVIKSKEHNVRKSFIDYLCHNTIEKHCSRNANEFYNNFVLDSDKNNNIEELNEIENSFFLLFENETLNEKEEIIRQLCKYTLFVPNKEPIINNDNNNTNIKDENNSLLTWRDTKNRFISILDKTIFNLQKSNQNDEQSNENKNDFILNNNPGQWSNFLSLTEPSIDNLIPIISELKLGVDAFEFRVDLLQNKTVHSLHRQLLLLYKIGEKKPIVYTVRTISQLGKYPDENYDEIINLLLEGLRGGVEWLDIEATLPTKKIEKLFDLINKKKYKKTSNIIGSLHSKKIENNDNILEMFKKCKLNNEKTVDILKVVVGASCLNDCFRIHDVAKKINKPYIGFFFLLLLLF
jgi:3-dehydroquinate dehydratase type I